MKSILLILFKNTSVLDFSVPVLLKIRQHNPSVKITVLYCHLGRRRILRKGVFYDRVFRENDITQCDLLDLATGPWKPVAKFLRLFIQNSKWDTKSQTAMPSVIRRLHGKLARPLRWLEGRIIGSIDIALGLGRIKPDTVLYDLRNFAFDHRVHAGASGIRESIDAFILRTRPRVFFLPHAPHGSTTDVFVAPPITGSHLPENFEYWTTSQGEDPETLLPQQPEKIQYIGYPGLDSEWLSRFKNRPGDGKCLRILFITRKVATQEAPTKDPYVLEEKEFERLIGMLSNALSECDIRAELIIKPHPSNDFSKIGKRFLQGKFERITVSFEPIYHELDRCDLVCSVYSTILLVPVAAGLPVFLFHSTVQDVVNRHELFKSLYTGLRYYIRTEEDLMRALMEHKAYQAARSGDNDPSPPWAGDIAHVRSHYPDGATTTCVSRLQGLE